MKIQVLVELEADTWLNPEAAQNAAVEAVDNALRHAEDTGFNHTWDSELSIHVTDVTLASGPAR